MKPATDNYERRDQIIATLLWYGTWLASTVIAIGMMLGVLQKIEGAPSFAHGGYDFVKAGVALFISLPIARVALMFVIFLREQDYAYMAISALVLAIIGAGVFVAL